MDSCLPQKVAKAFYAENPDNYYNSKTVRPFVKDRPQTESQVHSYSRCICYFYSGANAFSLAKLNNFVVHNIMLFFTSVIFS